MRSTKVISAVYSAYHTTKEQDLTEGHAAVSVEGNNRSSNLYIFSKQEKENYTSWQKNNEVIRQTIEEQTEPIRSK